MNTTAWGLWKFANVLDTNEPLVVAISNASRTRVYVARIADEKISIQKSNVPDGQFENFIEGPLTYQGVSEVSKALNAALRE